MSTDDWKPLLLLPNLNIRRAVECAYAAIVDRADSRFDEICRRNQNLADFLSRFSDQFGNQRWPALLIVREIAPHPCATYEARNAFRDLLSLSIVPLARADQLYRLRADPLAFSNSFQFYPLMIHKDTEVVVTTNHASFDFHLVRDFSRQTFPEQSPSFVKQTDVDVPLVSALLERWSARYAHGSTSRDDIKLFRSLNMANEAAQIPAAVASTIYDVGRTLALWVSALEILTHPGSTGKANFGTVADTIERVNWRRPALAARIYGVTFQGRPEIRPLASWIYKKIYDLRNDYLHGNDVSQGELWLNDRSIINFAACLFRFALTGFLSLEFTELEPPPTDAQALAGFRARRKRFYLPQDVMERAILKAI